MRISVKGRYALAAVVDVARKSDKGENVAVIQISGSLGISKIYLEQVFTQLKKSGILLSVKGARGGYRLARSPGKVTVWEVLSALEAALVEPTERTVEENAPETELAMQQLVFQPLDAALREFLGGITIQQLLDLADQQRGDQAFMLNM